MPVGKLVTHEGNTKVVLFLGSVQAASGPIVWLRTTVEIWSSAGPSKVPQAAGACSEPTERILRWFSNPVGLHRDDRKDGYEARPFSENLSFDRGRPHAHSTYIDAYNLTELRLKCLSTSVLFMYE